MNGLKLKKKDGSLLTADNLDDAIIELMKTEIEESIKEIGIKKMRSDIESSEWHGNN